ncbi:MAG TPA: hypothetical protein VNN74_03585 [Candidatus Micrarchaeia archaeon]|nr:hypothetical protein [Candidatus Micrarchaeia archaeon]
MLAAGGLAGCAGAGGAVLLQVTSTAVDSSGTPSTASVPQGQTGSFQVTLTNQTQQAASGVALRVALPAGLRYLTTLSIAEIGGAVRTADVDPPTGGATPVWGAWTIPPSVPGNPASVSLTIEVQAQGAPGRYQLTPDVLTAATSSEQDGPTLTMTVAPAPSLDFALRVAPGLAAAGTTVTYRATVTNSGSGPAVGTNLSVALPEGFVYQGTQTVGGTASTAGATAPIPGSTVPVWAGYDVPGAGSNGPGLLILVFQVQLPATVTAGSYAAGASLISGSGTAGATVQNYAALAPVTVP